MFSGLFEGVATLVDYLNPFSENFFLIGLFDFLGEALSYINPFDENFILNDVFTFLSDIVSFINPFSENFFVYKLIELLGDLIQWLFVPDDEYFSSNIDDLKSDLSTKIPYEDYIDMFGDIENVEGGNTSNINLNGYIVAGKQFGLNNFINFNWILQYKDTWYSWARGIVFILLIIYNINQIMKLFRGYSVGEGNSRINESSGGGEK